MWLVVVVTTLSQLIGASAQEEASYRKAVRSRPGAYVLGKVTRTETIRGRLFTEFGITQADGLRSGERLLVLRPTAGNAVIDEITVEIAGNQQSVGRCVHPRGAQQGDVVLYQRTLNLDDSPSAASRHLGDLYSEITFWSPPRGQSRNTFNARIERITWEGKIDIRDVEATVFLDGVRDVRMTIPAESFKQMRLNGLVLVVDGPKRTLVAAAVHDYREVVRADAAERERIEIAKARIAADEQVRIAAAQIAADARVRIAAANASAAADARVRIAEANASADADARVRIAEAHARAGSEERIRLAEIAARERTDKERLGRYDTYSRERVAANADSNEGLRRALTAAGGLLAIGAYFDPKHADALGGLAGAAALFQAIIP
jgi:hypothetical protein